MTQTASFVSKILGISETFWKYVWKILNKNVKKH